MRAWFIVLLVSVWFAAGLRSAAEEQTQEPPYDTAISATQALDIAEAAFRQYFQTHEGPRFILLFGADPSPEFLKRFADSKVPVRACSDEGKPKGHVCVWVSKITRVTDTTVTAKVGFRGGEISGGGFTYEMELKAGKWTVTRERRENPTSPI